MNQENDYIAFTGDTGDFELLHKNYEFAEIAQLFPNVNSILIPKKAEYNLRKYVSKDLLRTIDSDIDIAVEKCLVFLSNLASTYYTDSKWKPLSSTILHQQSRNADNTYIYTKIIDVLTAGTSKGAFVEVDGSYQVGSQSKKFRLTDTYLKAGLVEYFIKNAGIIRNRNKIYYNQWCEAMNNPICSNLIAMYPKIDLPTSEELLVIGKKLVKEGRTTKKGKILTVRNKHKDHYWLDVKNRSFVEDNIELFEFLTGRGFMIPSAGDISSGGRVVDSFSLMPAWIREQITIDGKKLPEFDFICLHPNEIIKLYDGSASYLTHQMVAERTGIDLKDVKIEHLSFFNKKWNDMRRSQLFEYYSTNEPDMLARIYHDKNEYGHKITSQKMFALEVDIMSAVISDLNAKGIYVLYVYDALMCEEKDRELVAQTMNRIILEHGVKTNVKVNTLETDVDLVEMIPEPEAVELPKYALDEIVNLYEVLPQLAFDVEDILKVISGIDNSNVEMAELIDYFNKQNIQQKYNDYEGVPITGSIISKLKNLIKS